MLDIKDADVISPETGVSVNFHDLRLIPLRLAALLFLYINHSPCVTWFGLSKFTDVSISTT